MFVRTNNKLRTITGLVLVIVLGSFLASSCTVYYPFFPYRTFSSTRADFDFTFKYPSDFELFETVMVSSVALWHSHDNIQNNIIVILINEEGYEDAQIKEQERFSTFSSSVNFTLLKRGSIVLDGATGYEFEAVYDAPKHPQLTDYERVWNWEIFIQRNGNKYHISASAIASQLDRIKEFQYLVETWKWKR